MLCQTAERVASGSSPLVTPVLAIVDMQAGEGNAQEELLILSIKRLIRAAIKGNWPVMVIELLDDGPCRPTNHGLMCLLNDYPRLVLCPKKQNDGSAEISQACMQNGFPTEHIVVCGVNADVCIKSTVLGLASRFRHSIIEVVKDACNACAATRHWLEMAETGNVQVTPSVEESIAGRLHLLSAVPPRKLDGLEIVRLRGSQEWVRVGDLARACGITCAQLWALYFHSSHSCSGRHSVARGKKVISAAKDLALNDDDYISAELAEAMLRANKIGAARLVLKCHQHHEAFRCTEPGALWCCRVSDGLYQAAIAVDGGRKPLNEAGTVPLV